MSKLLIQIPCYNEAQTLGETVKSLPRVMNGFDELEIIVIDDGSSDGTSNVASELGVSRVVNMNGHQGLARSFVSGLNACLDAHADVIVNTDADNQYCANDIPILVKPILDGVADMVIGHRQMHKIAHFSPLKKRLQLIGSRIVCFISGTCVVDATCGFRALTREAALRLAVFGQFTYTVETILQAGVCNLRIVSVPIDVNPPRRPSRLFRSNLSYVWRTILTIVSISLLYRPLYFFAVLTVLPLIPGLVLGFRYLYLIFLGEGVGHVQSVIACAGLLLTSLLMAALGVIAHLLSISRRMVEEVRYLSRRREYIGRETTCCWKGCDNVSISQVESGKKQQTLLSL